MVCKDQIWGIQPKMKGLSTQKAQNNEFIESGLEKRVRMSWISNKIGTIHKNRRID